MTEGETRETRLRRLRMRSWRRGMREMDLIFGRFADERLADLSAAELDKFKSVLDENDQDLYLWVSGAGKSPAEHAEILSIVAVFHQIER